MNETSNLTLKLTEYNESNVPLEVNGIEYLIMIWAFLYFFQIIREVFSLFYMFHLLLYKYNITNINIHLFLNRYISLRKKTFGTIGII